MRQGATGTSLSLLRRIRDVMAAPEPVQARLDKLVATIAEGFESEVCSIYLLRAGDILELYANIGLNPDAVHLTRLQVGQGLVGEIATNAHPLNLANAREHPQFVYRPETGEEMYHSFAGVPVIHGHKVVGVLVVQGREERGFASDQVEILQTVAMVLAEMVASGALINLTEINSASSGTLLPQHLSGLRLSPGLARGPAILHRPRIEITRTVADDPVFEVKRLHAALETLNDSVGALVASSGLKEGDAHHDIMEAYLLFAQDKGWRAQVTQGIESGLTAEAAVRMVQEQMHARLSAMANDYLRERIYDLEDMSSRLIQILSGHLTQTRRQDLPQEYILVATALGPAELLEYGQGRLKGLVLEEGSASSHVVIIARAMDIPVVGKIENATNVIEPGETLIIDGDHGEVYLRPNDAIDRQVTDHLEAQSKRLAHYAALQHLPPVTRSGERVHLYINAGLTIDTRQLEAPDISGIGLYRSELPYMTSPRFPSVTTQRDIYARVLQQAGGKRVVFRSFDIGGDKQVPYIPTEGEENPAMGWRATRIGLDRPAILRRQFRAFLMAAHGAPLTIMFPFITEVNEMDASKRLLMREWVRLEEEGHIMPSDLKIGAMIEVPSILFQMRQLLERVDFVSVGSNDLLQFFFACDRGSQLLTDRYDPLSPVVLRVLRGIIRSCNDAGVEVGFCGELARKPLEAAALVGLGFRNLSMPPSAIGPVKAMIRSLDLAQLAPFVDYLCDLDHHSVRQSLLSYARDHGIEI